MGRTLALLIHNETKKKFKQQQQTNKTKQKNTFLRSENC